jgi:beta-keto acid cleavage enzyme
MRKTKLSFDLLAQQHGDDGLFARFYRHPGSAVLLQQQVSKASISKIVGVSLPPFTALLREGGYAHTLKGYFYTNLGGTLQTPHLPITPREIADACLGAAEAGAAIAHIHVREPGSGKPSMNLGYYQDLT